MEIGFTINKLSKKLEINLSNYLDDIQLREMQSVSDFFVCYQ